MRLDGPDIPTRRHRARKREHIFAAAGSDIHDGVADLRLVQMEPVILGVGEMLAGLPRPAVPIGFSDAEYVGIREVIRAHTPNPYPVPEDFDVHTRQGGARHLRRAAGQRAPILARRLSDPHGCPPASDAVPEAAAGRRKGPRGRPAGGFPDAFGEPPEPFRDKLRTGPRAGCAHSPELRRGIAPTIPRNSRDRSTGVRAPPPRVPHPAPEFPQPAPSTRPPWGDRATPDSPAADSRRRASLP